MTDKTVSIPQALQLLEPKIFRIQMRDAVSAQARADLKQAFVFIHGFNVDFDEAVFRAAQIAHDLRFDGAPMLFSWPSRGNVRSYLYDQQSARGAVIYLVAFLEFVRTESGADIIHLIAHSMGNDPLMEALSALNHKHMDERPLFNEVILAAPDIDHDIFRQLASQVVGTAKGMTLYANQDDRALNVSRTIAGNIRRAGDLPPTILSDIDTIDVTPIGTDLLSLNHSTYADNPLLLNDIKLLFEQRLRPPNRRSVFITSRENQAGTYWYHSAP